MMGGTIQVESEVGKGTEFTVILECETSGVTVKREPIPELKGARALVAVSYTHLAVIKITVGKIEPHSGHPR